MASIRKTMELLKLFQLLKNASTYCNFANFMVFARILLIDKRPTRVVFSVLFFYYDSTHFSTRKARLNG